MTEFIAQFFEAVTVGSVLTSTLVGVLFGAFYGYLLRREGPALFPWGLLFIGWGFVLGFGAWAFVTGAAFQPAYQVARGFLWTITVVALPIGRLGRQRLDNRRHRSALDSLRR